jgi:transcriptional regulator with XRE-family HTH domain
MKYNIHYIPQKKKNMTIQHDIAKRLNTARKVAGYKTAKAFININKIPKTTYSQHERGDRGIKEDVLKKYAKLLNVNHKWLATGKGQPTKIKLDEKRAKLFSDEILNLEQIIKEPPLINEILLAEILITMNKTNKKITGKMFASGVTSLYSDIVRIQGSLEDQLKAVKPAVSTFLRYAHS